MSKNRLLSILFWAALLGLSVYLFSPDRKSVDAPKEKESKPSRKALGLEKKKEILSKSREDLRTTIEQNQDTKTSKLCRDFETEIAGWSSHEIFEGRHNLNRAIEDCYEDKKLKALTESFKKNCSQSFKQDDPEAEEFKTCLTDFMFLRAFVISKAYKQIPSHALSDTRILIDRLLASMTTGDYASGIEAADRLVELEPDLYDAHKARVTMRFIQTHMQKDGTLEWEVLDQIVDELKSFNMDDPEILDVVTMVESRAMKNPEAARNLAAELKENPATRSYGYYLEAAFQKAVGEDWSIEKADRALSILNQALTLSPTDKRFLETKKNLEELRTDLKAGKQTKERSPFVFNFGFRFDID